MADLQTPRLQLHAIDVREAERIIARQPAPTDVWAQDFPFEGDVGAIGAYLRATAESGDPHPFGYYTVVRLSDGCAIGGIGFKGQPVDGCVEIGYGLVPSARGRGYAAEALTVMLEVAAQHGLARVVADTTPDNVASQRTLLRAGFRLLRAEAGLNFYEITLKS